jgi:hypothetical protein
MRKTILSAMAMAVLGAAGPALAQTDCLSRAALQSQSDIYGPALELGLVDGSITLCARKKPDAPRSAGCWTLNPKIRATFARRWLPQITKAIYTMAKKAVWTSPSNPSGHTAAMWSWRRSSPTWIPITPPRA